ncbi:catecholate siderophore receptor [Blastomonas natatoria]|uniref:Catecholate siderophore receptor n=1 Tax=Blastomonas natatoria TaxID=34015 RepID=A0A2V3VRK3_9SPHN|nr:TonB-dependent siderophore receptor [Blastomonas natatoria]PXW79159.1 catecholate siderophore receptor [Blastomonas natatoria]
MGMPVTLRWTAGASFAAMVMVSLTGPAWAAAAEEAEAEAEVDDQREIIVTGRNEGYLALDIVRAAKTPTPLVDIPQAISVYTREQIEDQALQDLADVLRYTPGVSSNQGEGHRDQISIRGQDTTADFFVDGIRDDVQYYRPLYNLERVEVLKGSNALLFGRGGGGGVVNRVTKTPVLGETFIAGSASVDTFGAFALTSDINAALGSAAGLRLNAMYEEFDNHRDFFGGNRIAINPTIGAALGEMTRLLFSYEYVDDDRIVDRGIPSTTGGTIADPARPVRGFYRTFFGSPQLNTTTLTAHILRGRLEHGFTDSLRADLTVQYADYDKAYTNVFAAASNLAAGRVTLDSYRDAQQRENVFVQGNLVWTGQTGLLSHTLLAGFEYGDQQSANQRQNGRFAASGSNIVTFTFTDPLVVPAITFPVNNRNTRSQVNVASVYLQDQIGIGDHFDIVLGARYDRFEIDVNDIVANRLLSRTDSEWSPRLGLIFKPMEAMSLYASYTKTFLPRSGDQFLSLTPAQATLAPEAFDNYEFGAKWDIAENLRVSAAIFQLDRENGVVVDPANPANSILTGSRTRGFEAQFTGQILPGWQINAGYSYLDADERGRVVAGALANRSIGQVPRHMASLWNRYDIDDRLGIGLGVTHQASQFASISNTVRMPAFTRVDAALFLKLTDRIEAQLNVENLFDTRYFPASHNDNNITTGEPINARFTVRARF